MVYYNEVQNQRNLGPLEVTLPYLPAQAQTPTTCWLSQTMSGQFLTPAKMKTQQALWAICSSAQSKTMFSYA